MHWVRGGFSVQSDNFKRQNVHDAILVILIKVYLGPHIEVYV